MKHRKAIALVLSMCMLGLCLPQNTIHSEAAVKLKKIKLNKSFQVIKKGGKVKLKAAFTPKKAKTKITWKSSNKKVATVSRSGVVKGKKKGKATITAKVKGKKATCKIRVGIPVKKINTAKSLLSLNVGQSASVKGSVQPKNASVKKLTYTSNNKKVATVTATGLVRAVSAGTAQIELKSTDGNAVKRRVTVKVAANQSGNASNTIKPSETAVPTATAGAASPKPSPSSGVPSNSSEPDDTPEPVQYTDNEDDFLAALDNENLRELHFTSNEEVSITVPEENYSNVTIYINAPNAQISIEGTIKKICLENKSAITASNLAIYTNKRLMIENSIPFRLVIRKGGELTRVFSKEASVCPEILGMGNIYQKVEETGRETYVPAAATDEEIDEENVAVSGKVCSANGQTLSGASVLCVPYSRSYKVGDTLTDEQIQALEDAPDAVLMSVDADGTYREDTFLQGNYFVVIRASGYETVTGIMCITGHYQDNYVYDTVYLTPQSNTEQKGTVSGQLISDTDKKPIAAATLSLRRGMNNLSGDAVLETKTDAEGNYELSGVPYGNYTAEILHSGYVLSWKNIVVAAERQTETLYAGKRLQEDNQLRFAASWSGGIQDVNLHLVGPGINETEYHVWKDDAAIYEKGKLSMKLDAKTEAASQIETATIYQCGSGVYTISVCAVNGENDTTALAQSAMRLVVYSGDIVAAVLNVPQEEGNTWNALSYDSESDLLSVDGILNTVEMEQEIFEAYGQSYRSSILSLLAECQTYRENLSGDFKELDDKMDSLKQVLDTVFDEEQYAAAYESASEWFEALQEQFTVSVTGDDVEEYVSKWNDDAVIVYTTRQGVTIEELEIDFGDGDAVEKPDLCDAGALTAYQVTAESGVSRVFQIYVKTKLDYIVPIAASIRGGDVPIYLLEGYGSDYDAIYLYDMFSVNQVAVDFGRTGADAITYETDANGNIFVVVTMEGSRRRWQLISKVMPMITGANLGKVYRTSYEEDNRMNVYGEALPNVVAGEHYSLGIQQSGYRISAYEEAPFDADNDTELRIQVTIHKEDGSEPDRDVEITYMSVETCCEIENAFVRDTEGGIVPMETDEERPNFLLFAVEGEVNWETLKASFVDAGVTYSINTDVGAGKSYQAELKANFYGYEKTYYLKIE